MAITCWEDVPLGLRDGCRDMKDLIKKRLNQPETLKMMALLKALHEDGHVLLNTKFNPE